MTACPVDWVRVEQRLDTDFRKHGYVDTYNDSTQNYTQTVLVNGQLSATLSTSDGVAQGWGSAVECAATNCGTVPAHCKYRTLISSA